MRGWAPCTAPRHRPPRAAVQVPSLVCCTSQSINAGSRECIVTGHCAERCRGASAHHTRRLPCILEGRRRRELRVVLDVQHIPQRGKQVGSRPNICTPSPFSTPGCTRRAYMLNRTIAEIGAQRIGGRRDRRVDQFTRTRTAARVSNSSAHWVVCLNLTVRLKSAGKCILHSDK